MGNALIASSSDTCKQVFNFNKDLAKCYNFDGGCVVWSQPKPRFVQHHVDFAGDHASVVRQLNGLAGAGGAVVCWMKKVDVIGGGGAVVVGGATWTVVVGGANITVDVVGMGDVRSNLLVAGGVLAIVGLKDGGALEGMAGLPTSRELQAKFSCSQHQAFFLSDHSACQKSAPVRQLNVAFVVEPAAGNAMSRPELSPNQC